MAEFSGPWPQQTDFTLDAFRRHFRHARPDGPVKGLAVSAGTGQQIIVQGGQAYVDGLLYRSSLDPSPADVTLTAPTNTASNPRRHLVVLRLDPSDTSGGTQGSIKLAIKVGAAAASPVDPAPTQTDTGIFEMPLGSYLMPPSGQPQNPTEFFSPTSGDASIPGAAVADDTSVAWGNGSNALIFGNQSVVAPRTGLMTLNVHIVSYPGSGSAGGSVELFTDGPGGGIQRIVQVHNRGAGISLPVSITHKRWVTAGDSVLWQVWAQRSSIGASITTRYRSFDAWVE